MLTITIEECKITHVWRRSGIDQAYKKTRACNREEGKAYKSLIPVYKTLCRVVADTVWHGGNKD